MTINKRRKLTTLNKLEDPLLNSILSFLNNSDLASLGATNHNLRELTTQNIALRELASFLATQTQQSEYKNQHAKFSELLTQTTETGPKKTLTPKNLVKILLSLPHSFTTDLSSLFRKTLGSPQGLRIFYEVKTQRMARFSFIDGAKKNNKLFDLFKEIKESVSFQVRKALTSKIPRGSNARENMLIDEVKDLARIYTIIVVSENGSPEELLSLANDITYYDNAFDGYTFLWTIFTAKKLSRYAQKALNEMNMLREFL
jgi:hypothetical protein